MKREDLLERVEPLLPIDFFSLRAAIPFCKNLSAKKALLPDTSELLCEEQFAKVWMGWSQTALYFLAEVEEPFQDSFYPDYEVGDSIELFIDTRDLKEVSSPTRFCHHFLLFPQEVEGVRALEISRFRAEESHPLCDPDLIEIEVDQKRKGYQMRVVLPAAVLHGYDPEHLPRIGFTYKINRFKKAAQHFCLSSAEHKIARTPSLWATLHLER